MDNYTTNLSGTPRDTNKAEPQFVVEIQEMTKTLTLLGELQDRIYHKLSPVRNQMLTSSEPVVEPTSSTTEAPLVTSLKQLNYQATRILQNFSNTYDEIDL
jgi:hypothetical protein